MKIRLHYKLFAAILAASMVVVIYMTVTMQWSFDRGFRRYVSTMEFEQLQTVAVRLESHYKANGGWDNLKGNEELIVEIIFESYPESRKRKRLLQHLSEKGVPKPFLRSEQLPDDVPPFFGARVFLLDEHRHSVFGFAPAGSSEELIDLYHDNRIIGHLGLHSGQTLSEDKQLVFARHQRWVLMLVAVAALLIAAGLTLPITYMLTRPIRKMASVARSLAAGSYQARVQIGSRDELGQLAQDINDLGEILEKNKAARSQWIADISHELRTPLSILRGKIEALQDGVYQPGEALYQDLHQEVMRLGLLVEDLYQLSLSDIGAISYQRVEVEPCWALDQALSMLEPQLKAKELTLEKSTHLEGDITLIGDNERLKQLFINLLTNAIYYTDRDGTIRVQVNHSKGEIFFIIEDSFPGVSDTDLQHLFDRLYRVEGSRSRESGGAGLGLSICHSIVSAHGGTITPSHSSLGGLRVEVRLPQADYLEQL